MRWLLPLPSCRAVGLALALAANGCHGCDGPGSAPASSSTAVATAATQAAKRAGETIAPLRPSEPDRAAARRRARALYLKATLEGDNGKAQKLFLQAAAEVPPAGPALYQAGRAAARAGNAVEARGLFERALAALERSTHAAPALRLEPTRSGLLRLQAGAAGRLVMAATDSGTMVLDALLNWQPRFEHELGAAVSALTEDGTLVLMGQEGQLLSCSLVEATCTATSTASAVREIVLSASGDLATVLVGDGEVVSYDAATLEPSGRWSSPEGRISALGLAPAGDRLAVGLATGRVLWVTRETGEVTARIDGHQSPVLAVAIDPRRGRLVSASARSIRTAAPDGSASEELTAVSETEQDPVVGLVLSSDGKTLFVERESHVEIWSLDDKRRLAERMAGLDGLTRAQRVAPTHARIFVGVRRFSSMPWINISHGIAPFAWQAPGALGTAEPLSEGAHWSGSPLPEFTMQAAGGTLITANELCTVHAWNLEAGAFLRTTDKLNVFRGCSGVALSDDGRSVTGPSFMGGPVRVDLASGAGTPLPPTHEPGSSSPLRASLPESAVHAASAGPTVAWVDRESRIHVGGSTGPWPVVGKQYQAPDEESPSLRDPEAPLALSPDGALVAFRSGPDEARIVAAATGKALRTLSRSGVSGLAFGPDGRAFVASLDGAVAMLCLPESAFHTSPPWADGGATAFTHTDVACHERTIVSPSGGPLYALAPVRGGELLAGAIDGGPIYLWSTADGSLRAALQAVGAGAVAWAPDGRAELFGNVQQELSCRFGPFVVGPELCAERLETPGLLAALLKGRSTEP